MLGGRGHLSHNRGREGHSWPGKAMLAWRGRLGEEDT